MKRIGRLLSVFLIVFLLVSFMGMNLFIPEVKAQPSTFEFSMWDAEVDLTSGGLSLYRWYREEYFRLNLPFTVSAGYQNLTEKEGVKFTSSLADIEIYSEHDGIEYEVILKSKPPFQAVAFPIETSNLEFYYQPELTQEEIDNGCVRPANVVGSYAVYHSDSTNIYSDSKQADKYKVGKAFHIYRPLLIDAKNQTAWADLNITDSILTITLPKDFMESAVYPVTVDPRFGYETGGGSNWLINNYIRGSLFTSPASSGTGDYIRAAIYHTGGTAVGKFAVFTHSDSTLVAGGETVESSTLGNSLPPYWEWEKLELDDSPSISASTDYVLQAWSDTTGANIRYDAGGTDQGHDDGWVNYVQPDPSFPSPATWSHQDYKCSIYLSYTPSTSTCENYSTYSEVDVGADHLQFTDYHLDLEAHDNEDVYLYKDKGNDYFNEDFEHDNDFYVDYTSATGAIAWVWALTNNLDDMYAIRTTYDCLGVRLDKLATGIRLILYETVIGTPYYDSKTGLSLDTWYFLKIVRNETVGTYGTLYCGIYSTGALRDAGDGTDGDIDNLAVTLHEKEDFKYIYACSSSNLGSAPYMNVEVENLDLNVGDTTAPTYQNVGQEYDSIQPEGTNTLYAQGKDETALDWAWLWTNETGGSGTNYTSLELNAPNAETYKISDTGYYAENIVYDSSTSKYWWVFTDYNPTYYTIRIAWASTITGSWTVQSGNVLSESSVYLYAPHLVKFYNYWYIYYSREASSPYADVYAQRSSFVNQSYSTSGISNPIVAHGTGAEWDNERAGEPYVFMEGSTYYCFYMGENASTQNEDCGYATSTYPYQGFSKYGGNPVLPADGWPHGWDSGQDRAADPFVFFDGADWWVGVTGCSVAKNYWRIGFYKTNSTFTGFWHYADNPVLDYGDSGSWDDTKILRGAVTEFDDTFYFPYTGYEDDTTARMGITNLTVTHGAIDMGDAVDTWTWSNFTWYNASISSGSKIQWKIYYNDTSGNINGTGIHSFTVTSLQEYSEEFSETISVTTVSYVWKSKRYETSEEISPSATVLSWREKRSFYTESLLPIANMYRSRELQDVFTEPIAASAIGTFTKELITAFQEFFTETVSPVANAYFSKEMIAVFEQYFQETIAASSIFNAWKSKHFINQETVNLNYDFNEWLTLTRYFTETITPSGSLAIFKETLVTIIEFSELIKPIATLTTTYAAAPITIIAVLGIACIGLIIALIALVLVVNKKD